MKKACCRRQHGSCNVGAWRFGGTATASMTRATFWFGRRSTINGFSRERCANKFASCFWREIARHHGFEIEELEVDTDHGHLFLSFPPKYSIGQVVGVFKAMSAQEIRAAFPGVRKQLWGGEFGENGYVARTVGDPVTAEVSKKYSVS